MVGGHLFSTRRRPHSTTQALYETRSTQKQRNSVNLCKQFLSNVTVESSRRPQRWAEAPACDSGQRQQRQRRQQHRRHGSACHWPPWLLWPQQPATLRQQGTVIEATNATNATNAIAGGSQETTLSCDPKGHGKGALGIQGLTVSA